MTDAWGSREFLMNNKETEVYFMQAGPDNCGETTKQRHEAHGVEK